MTQTVILAPGQDNDTSTDVTVAVNANAKIGLYGAALDVPTADTFATAATGGTLTDSTTYYYRVSAINAVGETTAFAEQSQATGTGTDENTVTVNWLAVTGATGYRVYGRDTGAELLLAEVGAVLTYVDDGSITPDGALPSANTTAGGLPAAAFAIVYEDTPGADNPIAQLTGVRPSLAIAAPGTYRVTRADCSEFGLNIGIFSET